MSSQNGVATLARKDDDQEMPAAKITKLMQIAQLKQTEFASSEDSVHHGYYITKESLLEAKEQLIQLTKNKKEINASIQKRRMAGAGQLRTIIRERRLLIAWLSLDSVPSLVEQAQHEWRGRILRGLQKRVSDMYSTEKDLVSVEDLLGRHEAVWHLAQMACQELEAKIDAFEGAVKRSGHPGLSVDDLPVMQAMTKLTDRPVPRSLPARLQQDQSKTRGTHGASFALFSKLPVEVRLMIWRAGLPGPRVLTYHSIHNRRLSLLAVCTESRQIARAQYLRFLSHGPEFPRTGSSVIYIDPDVDTIIKDLTWQSSDTVGASLFDPEGPALELRSLRLFTGLAKVKHLALGFDFDFLQNNLGALFAQLEAVCPNLRSLTLFPGFELQGWCLKHGQRLCNCQELRFVDLDSNFVDLQSFRRDRCRDRVRRWEAPRLMAIAHFERLAQQYRILFTKYIQTHGHDWKPSLKIGLLMQWNSKYQGWQTRYLKGDDHYVGFLGDDGDTYHGFIESGIACGADGELLSRYDGIRELFAEET